MKTTPSLLQAAYSSVAYLVAGGNNSKHNPSTASYLPLSSSRSGGGSGSGRQSSTTPHCSSSDDNDDEEKTFQSSSSSSSSSEDAATGLASPSSQASPRNSISYPTTPYSSNIGSTSSGRSKRASLRSCCISQSSSSTSPTPSTSYCRLIHSLLNLAILGLALVGLFSIVAFLVGLIQKTPIYSERALQDSGWTRRPIRLSSGVVGGGGGGGGGGGSTIHDAGSSSHSHTPIYHGITVHDFTPTYPAHSRYGLTRSRTSARGEDGTHAYPTAPDDNDNRQGFDDPLGNASPSTSSAATNSDPPGSASAPAPAILPSDALHLLILCPLRNSAEDLPHLFQQLDQLRHPFSNTSLGFLIGDEDDNTGDVLLDLVQERMGDPAREYRHVTLLHKDFNVDMPSGGNRHSYFLQQQRRTVMARARTYLLTSTLEPSVDWVLWLDSDIAEFSPTLFEDLLVYGNGGVIAPSAPKQQHLLANHIKFQQEQTRHLINLERGLVEKSASPAPPSSAPATVDGQVGELPRKEWNDVIIPNAMRRNPDATLLGFDMNNWAETPESLKRKEALRPDELLIEGNIWQHMHRKHLADFYTSYVNSSSPQEQQVQGPQVFSLSAMDSISEHDPRLDTASDAYIGRLMPLDGIGGVAALVRAEVHRMGAIFPSWIFENQLETEAFGVLAKKMGARVVGLPNLFVLHST